ncbi:hypothetical protein C3L33_11811, partial [Rhododendron williamsianum]
MPREQLEVLNALDVAKTQLYHFTAIVIAGMGFFTDAYDLFSISVVTKLLGRIYYTQPDASKPGILPVKISAAVTGVALVGTLFGQLFFGWLGDKMGRKKVYGLTLALMIFCSLASGLSFGHHARGTMATLCFFRFWLGFGIGGDYPLSATIMSEYANKKTRGSFIAAVLQCKVHHVSEDDPGYPKGIGVKYSLIVLGFVSLLGMGFTFLVPEANGKSLEEMSGENEDDTIDAAEESTPDKQGAYNRTAPV